VGEGGLQLVGQATLEVGCGGAAEQVGDDAGIGLEGADLAVVPVPGWAEYRSRLPIGPPCSSTGTLIPAWNPAVRRTNRAPSGSGSVPAFRTVMAIRWENAVRHGPIPSRSCSSSTSWTAGRMRCPTKLSIGVSEHEAGYVGAEQGRGGHHDLAAGWRSGHARDPGHGVRRCSRPGQQGRSALSDLPASKTAKRW
jgi:hypothetical protein